MQTSLSMTGTFKFDSEVTDIEFINKYSKKTAIDTVMDIIKTKLEGDSNDVLNHIYFLEGKTGCGKSTMLPRSLFKFFKCPIHVVEPRVNLAMSVPDSLASFATELSIGNNLGYVTGPYKVVPSNETSITYFTTEIYRRKLLKSVNSKSIVIIDEVHIMDQQLVNLLKVIRDIIYDHKSKKTLNTIPLFIFQSATIVIEPLSDYFTKLPYKTVKKNPLMIAYIAGKHNFDRVDKSLNELYEGEMSIKTFIPLLLNQILDKSVNSKEVTSNKDPVRDILVFCCGRRFIDTIMNEIVKYANGDNSSTNEVDKAEFNKELLKSGSRECLLHNHLPCLCVDVNVSNEDVIKWRSKHVNKNRVLVLPYMSSLSNFTSELLKTSIDPDKESRKNEIKIYLSTDAIEAGKTIDSLYQVIETGVHFSMYPHPLTYNPYSNQWMIIKAPTTKSSVQQKVGRVGRKAPGISWLTYGFDTYELLDDYPYPDNVNRISNAADIVNTCKVGDKIDVLKSNDYIYPDSIDTCIRTSQDLVNGGFMTPFGVVIDDVHKYSIENNYNTYLLWSKYSVYNYRVDLFETLLCGRLNRNDISKLLTPIKLSIKDLPNKTSDSSSNEMCNAILDARQDYLKIMYNKQYTVL